MTILENRRALARSRLIIMVLTVAAYLPTFTGGFILDDGPLVKENPHIREFHSPFFYLNQEDGVSLGEGGDYHTGYYRPLVNGTYAVDYKLWGMDARGFRVTNLFLHVLTGLLFFQTLIILGFERRVALVSVLMFALHPVHTETVSWITSRNNILVAFFGLAALVLYIRAWEKSKSVFLILSALAFGAAVLSKEFGLMVLPVIFIYNRLSISEKRNLIEECLSYLPFAIVTVFYLLARSHVTGSLLSPSEGGDLWQRVFFAPYLIAWNLRLILMPYGLHSFIVHYPPYGPGWQALTGFFCLVLLGLMIWREKREKLVSFALLSFLIVLFPVLNIIKTSAVSLVSMRWLYFPLLLLFFAMPRLLERTLKSGGRLIWVTIVLVILYLGTYAHVLNRTLWHNETAFFQKEALHFKNSFYVGGFAENLLSRGKYREAEPYFQQAISNYPARADHLINYSALLLETGRPGAALSMLEKGRSLNMTRKERAEWFNNVGMAHFQMKNGNEALKCFRKAVEIYPNEAVFWSNLGGAYGSEGSYPKAVTAFQRGLSIAPGSVSLRENLAFTHLKMGDREKALDVLKELPAHERGSNRRVMRLIRQAREKPSNRGD